MANAKVSDYITAFLLIFCIVAGASTLISIAIGEASSAGQEFIPSQDTRYSSFMSYANRSEEMFGNISAVGQNAKQDSTNTLFSFLDNVYMKAKATLTLFALPIDLGINMVGGTARILGLPEWITWLITGLIILAVTTAIITFFTYKEL